VYGVALFLALPLVNALFLGDKYAGLNQLIICWLGLSLITAIRSIGMSAMLASKDSFRPLFYYGLYALCIAVPGSIVGSMLGKTYLAIIALICAESVLAALVWLRGWPKIRSIASTQGAK
jgi:hypothetical protein